MFSRVNSWVHRETNLFSKFDIESTGYFKAKSSILRFNFNLFSNYWTKKCFENASSFKSALRRNSSISSGSISKAVSDEFYTSQRSGHANRRRSVFHETKESSGIFCCCCFWFFSFFYKKLRKNKSKVSAEAQAQRRQN